MRSAVVVAHTEPPLNEVEVRRLGPEDFEFLRAMFLETISWRENGPGRSLKEVLATPDLARYVVGWGRPGDAGVVAVSNSGERVGAAWYRIFNEDDRGYGFVSSEVPELGIATKAEYRGRRLGRKLMETLIRLAMEQSFPALSLSVEADNWKALRLYESLGFVCVQQVPNAWTMLLTLRSPRGGR
jgi:ribosomal protein S18 acetylase RimI-like enzyme